MIAKVAATHAALHVVEWLVGATVMETLGQLRHQQAGQDDNGLNDQQDPCDLEDPDEMHDEEVEEFDFEVEADL